MKMMNKILAATSVLAAIAAAAPADAAATFAIGNTGIGFYTVNGAAAAVVTSPVWSANTATSSWISVNASGNGAPDTTYNYSTSFNVSGADGAASLANLLLAADDTITSISLSGASGSRTLYTGSGTNNYPTLTPFALNLGVLANGVNTLTFSVYNQMPNGTANPTGFRLETAGAVPEPASWAMMIGGFGMVGAALRRRRTATVRFA